MWYKVSLFLSILCLAFFSSSSLVFAESIKSFHSDISIYEDARVEVTETIEYDFGLDERHGIFREIPVVYENSDNRKFKVKYEVLGVTDQFGNPYPYSVSQSGDDISIKIGDPDKTITGVNSYNIKYAMRGPVQYFSEHDELAWNVTGNGWEVPIHQASALIRYVAKDTNASYITTDSWCYTGYTGSKDTECVYRVDQGTDQFITKLPLGPGQGLSVGIGFPKGYVNFYQMEEVADYSWLFGWIMAFYFLVGWILLPICLVIWWYKRGRDPKVQPVVRQFDPPKRKAGQWMSPLELGVLVDEVMHPRDISALLVSLAIKKYVIFKEHPKKLGGLIKGNVDFLRGPALEKDLDMKDLSKHEKTLLSAIGLDVMDSVTGIGLKVNSSFHKKIKNLEKDVLEDMVADGYFPKNPKKVRNVYLGLGVASMFIFNIVPAIILFVLSRVMSKRTLKGAQAKREGMGLLKFLKSQDRQYKFQEERAMMFEKLLPYAISFGVARIWADKFEDLTDYKPDWYQGHDGAFTTAAFTNSLNDSLSTVQGAYTPTSTSSSSGFSSGGGGFSGGGFSGGGGGSW